MKSLYDWWPKVFEPNGEETKDDDKDDDVDDDDDEDVVDEDDDIYDHDDDVYDNDDIVMVSNVDDGTMTEKKISWRHDDSWPNRCER